MHGKKVAPYVVGHSQIIHKSFKTLDEAKMALDEYAKQHPENFFTRREGKAPATAFKRSKSMGERVQQRTEIKVCRKNLQTTLSSISSWTDEKKTILGYYPINREQLTKLVVFPETSPADAYQFFLYGLIDTILIFKDLSVLSEFPHNLVETVKRFKKMVDKDCVRDISLSFISSQPIFDKEGDCVVPAYHIIFISVFHNRFPVLGEIKSLEDYEDPERLAGSLARIFYKVQKWSNNSHIRINYASKNSILFSHQRKMISPREWHSVVELETTFYNFEGLLTKLPQEVKMRLCFLLRSEADHKCALCTEEMDESSPTNNLSAENDKHSNGISDVDPCQEEEDKMSSSSAASFDIIV